MPHARSRTLLVLGAVLALSGPHSPTAQAQVPSPDALAQLDHRLERSARVRILTLAGFVEAKRVRLDSKGLTYQDIISTTPRELIQAPDTVTWDEILGVDAQVSKAGRTAVGMGALLATVGLYGGIASDIADGNSTNAFPAAAIGAASGALLGAAIGSQIHVWVRVYPPSGTTTDYVAIGPDTTRSAQTRLIAVAPLATFTGRKHAAKESQKPCEGIVRELTRRSDSRAISVQALAETDRRIREASPIESAESRLSPNDICRLLEADAVVMGAITRYRHSKAEVDLVIYEGASGKRIWRQNVYKRGKAIGATIAEAFPPKRRTDSPR